MSWIKTMGTKPKILIIRPSALGDTLMLLPSLVPLITLAEILFVGKRPSLDLLKPFVHLDLDYDGPGWHRLYMDTVEPGTALPLPPVDPMVAFLNDPDGNVKVNLEANFPKTTIHIFPPFPAEGEKIHVAFYLAQCLQRSGLPIDAAKCIDEARRRAIFMDKLKPDRKGKIIFHPGSGGVSKNHPPDFWLELIKRSSNSSRFKNKNFLTLLGPAEASLHRFFSEKLNQESSEILISPGWETLLPLLSESPLYFGQDSGITHLAAMHGTPTIALFRNSSINQWAPIGPAVRVIVDKGDATGLVRKTLREAESLTDTTSRQNNPNNTNSYRNRTD